MLFYTENVLKFAFSQTDNVEFNKDNKLRFAILGVPFDGTTSYKPGARFGPRSVREASYNFEGYNLILDKTISAELYDFGDLEVVHGNFKKTCSNLKITISELLAMKMVPITIGGDHSISYCVLKAMDESNAVEMGEITVIHFDAHMDMRDHYMGEKYSHATVMHRIFDLNPKEIIQIGIRSASIDEVGLVNKYNIKTFKSCDVDGNINEIIKLLEKIQNPIYLSFDIDVLDPAYAPSVGTPSTCGLSPKQVEKLIYSFKGKKIIGMDMVEVSSTEIGDITSLNAAKIIYDILFMQ
ncbi:MAG: agmatinase [Methanobacterium sp.]|nr:agmatinase [Methanobacterium sp.]